MPRVWREIGAHRVKWGEAHVKECIERGMRGEPDWFYAFEAGHVVGTPFQADSEVVKLLQLAVTLGGGYAMVMRPPAPEAKHGA